MSPPQHANLQENSLGQQKSPRFGNFVAIACAACSDYERGWAGGVAAPSIARMSLRTCLVASIALAALATAGCGGDTIEASELESEIQKDLTADVGTAPKAIECPDGIEIEKGRRFECTGTAPDGSGFRIDVVLTNDDGGFDAVVPREQFQ
jgi:hypothetical protein